MRAIAVILVALAVLMPAAARASAPAVPARPSAVGGTWTVHLDGVAVRVTPRTRQAITVRHTAGWHAVVRLWSLRKGRWARVATARDGRTGAGGLVAGAQRHQGTETTPLGTYRLLSAFGTHARSGAWRLPYRRIGPGDFWVEDNASRFYNRWRNQRQGGFRWRLPASAENGSERLSDYPEQYEYAVVTSFNRDQVRHRGAGIFLHVNGRGATGGCVSAPRAFLRTVLARLRPDAEPVIAIGR